MRRCARRTASECTYMGLAVFLRPLYAPVLEDIVAMVSLCCRMLIVFVCGACTDCTEATFGCYTWNIRCLVEALGALYWDTYYADTDTMKALNTSWFYHSLLS